MLGVADESFERLAEALVGDPGADEMVVDVTGEAGTTVGASLMVENERSQPAVVSCRAVPNEGFGLVSAPEQFQLAPDESRRVAIRVMLPAEPSDGPVDAGSVTVAGTGDRDLLVWVRAEVVAPAPAARGNS
jgi:hypothetical protein